MKNKKLLSGILATSLVTLSVVGCGSADSTTSTESTNSETTQAAETTEAKAEETTAETTTAEAADSEEDIVIRMAWWGNQTRTDLTIQALNLYTELHPNVTFETEPTDWSGYWDKLATQAATGALPDIYQMDYGYTATYYNQDLLLNLTPYVESGIISTDKISEAVLSSGSFDGNLYAMCAGLNSPCLLYDVETIEKAGITIPDQMTWDQFYEYADTIYQKTGVQTYVDSMILGMLFRGDGTSEFAADGTKFGVDDETVFTEYYQMIADAFASDWEVSPEILVEKDPTVTETMPIVDQTTWNSFTNSNQFTTIGSTAGREMGITMWPCSSDDVSQVQYLKSSQFFCGNSKTEHPEVVADVINFLINTVEANEILNGERGVPVNSDVLASFSDRLSEEDKIVYEYIDKINAVATPMDPPAPSGSSEIGTLVNDYTEQVEYGQLTPEEAGLKTFEEGNAILATESGN